MTENEKELEKSGTYRGFLLYFVLVLPVRRISSDRGIIGSGVYRNTTVQMEENYVARTALSYVAEKVRQHDTSGGVRLTEEEGETVLVLQNTENTTDTDYLTYIYSYDGWLCELVIRPVFQSPGRTDPGNRYVPSRKRGKWISKDHSL